MNNTGFGGGCKLTEFNLADFYLADFELTFGHLS
jgi:hypothetical protein